MEEAYWRLKNRKMISRNIKIKFAWITVLLFTLLLAGTSWAEETQAQPNIVMVFIDDMGWSDFSCFGNQDAKTPNIDRMAEEGIAFEQFYVNSPVCSPLSRCDPDRELSRPLAD